MTYVESITLSPNEISLNKGERYLTAYTIKPSGATVKTVSWQSTDTNVATVDSNGIITAIDVGTCRINATANDGSNISGYTVVTVVAEETVVLVNDINLSRTTLSLEKGEFYPLTADVLPSTAADKSVVWTSSNTSIATVNGGVVCAVGVGTTTVKAKANDGSGIYADCIVTVTEDILVTSVKISSYDSTMKVGEAYDFEVTVSPSNATVKNVKWTSSNVQVATVTADSGIVSALSEGTVDITATATDGSGKYDTVTVTVSKEIKVNSITLNKSELVLEEGQQYTLVASVNPSNADNKVLSWCSSNEDIAVVSNGTVTAIKEGSAFIYAGATDESDVCVSCEVTVTGDILVSAVSVTPSAITMLVGDAMELTATVYPNDAANKSVKWCTSNENIATVTPEGIVNAVGVGNAVIYVGSTDGSDKVDICNVAVHPVIVESIVLGYEVLEANEGSSYYPPSVTIKPTNATNKSVKWCSDNADVVDIDTDFGCIHAKSQGSARIYAVAQDGSNIMASCLVNVGPPVPVETITISHHSHYVLVGKSIELAVTVLPNDAADKSIVWSCNDYDGDIAVVDEKTGVVTGKSVGTVEITATAKNGVQGKIEISVVHDIVTVTKDGLFTKIEFETPDKIWYGINRDMITDSLNIINPELCERNNMNTFTTQTPFANTVIWSDPKTYSEDEMKLLYYLDPHGFAKYVQTYADYVGGSDISKVVAFKDSVFKILFDIPLYFQRDGEGEWSEVDPSVTTTINFDDAISESEFIFGSHNLWGDITEEALWSCLFELVSMVTQFPVLRNLGKLGDLVEVIHDCNAFYQLMFSLGQALDQDDFAGFMSSQIADKAIEDYRAGNYALDWSLSMVSLYDSVNSLFEALLDKPTYYPELYDYSSYRTNYGIQVKIGNSFVSLKKLGKTYKEFVQE